MVDCAPPSPFVAAAPRRRVTVTDWAGQVRGRVFGRLIAMFALAALTAGCFQPMYAERSPDGGSALRDKLQGIDIPPIPLPNGSAVARIGVELRNALAFNLYGAAVGGPPTHTLILRLSTTQISTIVDVTTSRPDLINYGIDASYNLKEVATGTVVLTGTTFARASYDVPGQEQRFARSRALRDAENRAAKVIADNISTRLQSFMYAGK